MKLEFSPLINSADQKVVIASHSFNRWLKEAKKAYTLQRIRIDSVDMVVRNGRPFPLFIKARCLAIAPTGESYDHTVLIRGLAVAILVVLICENSKYLLLVEQSRLPIASPSFLEIPAGMLDESDDSAAVAIKELSEETGLAVEKSQLNLLHPALAISCGILDEKEALNAVEISVNVAELEKFKNRKQSYDEENENIITRVIPYEKAAEVFLDSKGIAALYFYEKLRSGE